MRLALRVAVVAMACTLFGCAKPNVGEAIYDGFGPNYNLMKPALARPSANAPNYDTNNFRYVPGALTVPVLTTRVMI